MVEARTRYVIMIKYMLGQKNYVTSAALAEAAGVSVRTVKYDLKELRSFLTTYGVEIESKRAYGYRLLVGENADLEGLSKVLRANLRRNKGEVFRYNFQRVIYIINRLLIGKPYYRAEELMDLFYISRSTLTQDLNRARILLSKFRLEIDVNLRRGIGVIGSEMDRRLCIAEYFFRYDDKLQVMVQRSRGNGVLDWDSQRAFFVTVIQEACSRRKIRLSPFLAVDLASHMYVSVLRMRAGYIIDAFRKDGGRTEEVEAVLGYGRGSRFAGQSGEYYASEEIADRLEAHFQMQIPETERQYFALHIMSKKLPDGGFLATGEHATLKQCVKEILREIRDNFELDLSDDPVFRDFLYTNIEPMVFRLRTHLIVRNPLLSENLRRCLFATKVAHSASGIIEKLFGVQMDNNEFAYMVPVFHMSIGAHEKRKKFKVGFCGDLGLPESLLYYSELAEYLPRDSYDLIWLDRYHNAGYIDQIQYVIYVDSFRLPMPLPGYELREGDTAQTVSDQIARYKMGELCLDRYLKPEFCVFGLEGQNRDQVMENVYVALLDRGLINTVLDWKSAFRANEVGNGIAHIQDLGRILKNAGCYVFVLKAPILWEQDIIRMLVMIKTKRDGDKDLPLLCRIISNWTSSPEKVEHFLKARSWEVFCRDIEEECLKLCVQSVI